MNVIVLIWNCKKLKRENQHCDGRNQFQEVARVMEIWKYKNIEIHGFQNNKDINWWNNGKMLIQLGGGENLRGH